MFYPHYGFNFVATILIIIGALALLTNLGVLETSIWKWWPVLLIVFAIYILILKKKKKKIVASHMFNKIASDDRVQGKVKKILEMVDTVIDKKLDEWQDEAEDGKKTKRKTSRRK